MLSITQNCISKELDRKCSITIHNLNAHVTLDAPRYFNNHGCTVSAIAPEIVNEDMQTLEFAKTPFSRHGLNGVLVYQIKCAIQQNEDDDGFALAIMWDIPSLMKLGKSNSFAVGISKGLVADKALCTLMAKGSADWFQRKTTDTCKIDLAIDDKEVRISATLSDANSAILSLIMK